MVSDGSKSQNLPVPVQTLVVILHHQVRNKAGVKVSIVQTAKCRCLDAPHDKEESSSSETEDDDDDKDEGAVTKMKLLKKCKK